MALLIGAAIVGAVAGAAASTTAVIITNNRWTDITNQASKPVVVTVDGEEATIQSESTRRFKVKNATPIRIKVRWPKSEESDLELEIDDYSHADYIVADCGTWGLQIDKKQKTGKLQHQ